MLTAHDLLELLANILADDGVPKSRIRSAYDDFKKRMTDSDARLFTSVKILHGLIAGKSQKRRVG